MEHDVIIVGGGPVGLATACELALAGVAPLVLEKRLKPTEQDRAGVLHTRTVESLDIRGLLDQFLEGVNTVEGLPFAGIFGRGLEHRLLDTPFQYSLLIPQWRTEELLAKRATELGVQVQREHEVIGLRQDSDGVTLDVSTPAGPRTFRSRYVVGCDGGRSAVRQAAGIRFEGFAPSVSALLGYVTLDEKNVPRRWNRLEKGLLVLAFPPEGGIGRVVVAEYGRPHPGPDTPVTLQELREAVARVCGRSFDFREPVRMLSRFSDATLQAERYRSGRVFLAGDAAHVHFPIGGQGLNTGFQDAMNLGWKLAAQVNGWAPPGLLDTYHAERHPVGARMLRNTRAQLALMNPDVQHTSALRELFEELLELEELRRHLTEVMTALDIRYATMAADDDRLSGRFTPDLRFSAAGEQTRLAELLHEGKGVFVHRAERADLGRAAAPWAGRIKAVAADGDAPDLPEGILVRPDGYVAWAATAQDGGPQAESGGRPSVEGLTQALLTWFGSPK